MNIQEIKSAKGISAWFVQEPNIPIVVMNFSFDGGSSQDPKGKSGVGYLLSSMLDEGAGEYNAKAFQELLQEHSIEIGFNSDRDQFEGSLRTLSPNRNEAFRLLNLALTKPRFDEDAITRMKSQILAGLKSESENPDRIASIVWGQKAFPNHPYANPSHGTIDSMASLKAEDLKNFVANNFARKNLKVVIVGNLTVDDAKAALDQVFGNLPESPKLTPVADIKMATTPSLTVDTRKVPQTTLVFGMPAMKRHDPDFMPATVVMHLLGGGGLNSRLFKEVREKRGLTYGVYASLETYEASGYIAGAMSTGNDKAKEALDVIRQEFANLADKGPEQEELERTKAFLIGSFPLRLDSSKKIATQLLSYYQQGLPPSYMDERRKLIEAVTLADAKRVAAKWLKNDMLVVAVGQPQGLK